MYLVFFYNLRLFRWKFELFPDHPRVTKILLYIILSTTILLIVKKKNPNVYLQSENNRKFVQLIMELINRQQYEVLRKNKCSKCVNVYTNWIHVTRVLSINPNWNSWSQILHLCIFSQLILNYKRGLTS